MAAPNGTTWGSIAGGYGRIGIYVGLSSTATKTTVTISTWFWSKYSVSDTSNSYYYDNNATSATSLVGSVSLKTSVDSGGGWSTSNQVKLGQSTYTYDRGTSDVTRSCAIKLINVDRVGAAMTHSRSYTIPKLASYTVSYNANGGSGAPGKQTKWYGKLLTLSSTKPTRTGYSFLGWSTSKTATAATYGAGGSYTANSTATLYAVWKANTYTISYNANGGSGAPGKQTKTYGVALTLSSTKPTKTNYNFLGWSTSATATTAQYAAGGTYTSNSTTTLYAVWELAYVRPRINGLQVDRMKPVVDEEGNVTGYEQSDEGTNVSVKFGWECDQSVSSIVIEWKASSVDAKSVTYTSTELSGTIDEILPDDKISADLTYTITVTITDANGYSEVYTTLPGSKFIIDILNGGKGIAFNKPAELEGVADFGFGIKPNEGFVNIPILENTDLDTLNKPNTYVSYGGEVADTYINCPVTSGTFTLDVSSAGMQGQIRQVITYTNKTTPVAWIRYYYSDGWGDWVCILQTTGEKVLWGGDMTSGMYMTAGHTANLLQPVSKQQHGIVLVFSSYNGAEDTNYNWQCFFVPKYLVSVTTSGHAFTLNRGKFTTVGTKYLYIHDQKITGHVDNDATGTANGITYANNKFVLRYVLGV